MEHQLCIRGGTVVDGTGTSPFASDVAIDDGVITAVGEDLGRASVEIDASECLVTPGWVDPHTHYDGQATWDRELSPSGWHGVTTAVLGNCGVGFAPARPDRHEWLIGLMEGVEDIPGAVLSAGIDWAWEDFPGYLDALDAMPRTMDVAAQIPHGAVRAYVMGERGAKNEPASESDIAEMAQVVREGLIAGAVGFTTSRTVVHRSVDGEPVPGTFASSDELLGICAALGDVGVGVVGATSDFKDEEGELTWMEQVASATGRPVTFSVVETYDDPSQWRRLLDGAWAARSRGAMLVPQVAGREPGILMGLEGTVHPFSRNRTYQTLSGLPLAERVAKMREPEVRKAILDEPPPAKGYSAIYATAFERLFPLGDPPDYEPAPSQSIAAIAHRQGMSPSAVAYDHLLQRDGRELLFFPLLGYGGGNLDVVGQMLTEDGTVVGLADGGAHYGFVSDSGQPTFMLSHWCRDRTRGPRLPLAKVVHMLTKVPADLFGFTDRGVVAPGYRADLNVIDFDELSVTPPEVVYDLPGGGRRIVQRAKGYRHTIAGGVVTYNDGVLTGAYPGRVVRSRPL